MSCHSKEKLENMLEDVINELGLAEMDKFTFQDKTKELAKSIRLWAKKEFEGLVDKHVTQCTGDFCDKKITCDECLGYIDKQDLKQSLKNWAEKDSL